MSSSVSAWALASHDLSVERRTKELTTVGTVVAIVLVVAIGIPLAGVQSGPATAAVAWIVASFVTVVVAGRAFSRPADLGTMEGFLLLPADRSTLFVGKWIGTVVLALAIETVAILAHVALFNVPLGALSPGFALVVVLGTFGLVAAGIAVSAIAAQTHAREALLPVLLVPLALPVLLGGLPASLHAIAGDPVSSYAGELVFLAGYAIAFLAAGALLFDFVVEGWT